MQPWQKNQEGHYRHPTNSLRIQIQREYEETLKKVSDRKQKDGTDKIGDVVKEIKCINYMFILWKTKLEEKLQL